MINFLDILKNFLWLFQFLVFNMFKIYFYHYAHTKSMPVLTSDFSQGKYISILGLIIGSSAMVLYLIMTFEYILKISSRNLKEYLTPMNLRE